MPTINHLTRRNVTHLIITVLCAITICVGTVFLWGIVTIAFLFVINVSGKPELAPVLDALAGQGEWILPTAVIVGAIGGFAIWRILNRAPAKTAAALPTDSKSLPEAETEGPRT